MTDVATSLDVVSTDAAAPEVKTPTRAGRLLATAVMVGLCTDLVVRQPGPGTAWMVWGSAIVVGMAATVARSRRAALVVLACAWLFVPWFVLRSSAWLLVPNALAYFALVTYAADLSAGGPVRRSVLGLTRVAVGWLPACTEAAPFAWRGITEALDASGRRRAVPWRRIGRSLLIVLPVIVVLAVLLATGDALFAATFRIESASALDHLVWVPLGAAFFALLATMATAPGRSPEPSGSSRLRPLDATLLLGSVAVLFTAYASVQLSALLSGADYVEEQTGLTYAEYARSGFFQLMAAAVISFVVLCAVREPVRRATRGERSLRWLIVSVIVLTLVLVVGSIIRIRLYSDVFGLTHLRLYTVVAAGWLGVVVVLAGVVAILRRPSTSWMAVSAAALAAVAVFGMNVVNPDALVARENIGRVDDSVARFDGVYLAGLSADAVPWIISHIDEIPADQRAEVLARLCANEFDVEGWASWNRAESRARAALEAVCD